MASATSPSDPRPPAWTLPWRSHALAAIVALIAIIAGVPLFLAMPPWVDVTLYDVAVRNLLRGGVHYRDVFDTNLPGIVWAMAMLRSLFGWSVEALRACDLVVIGATTGLLGLMVRRAGGTRASSMWFVAAVALFYPFTSEFSHCQRDPWMLFPAVVATFLRARTLDSWRFRTSVVEGFVWGIAIWIKPHVLVPAACVWLASLIGSSSRPRMRDALGLLTGGVLAAVPGLFWLLETGAWPYFIEVFLRWNPEYQSQTLAELPDRLCGMLDFFAPFGVLHVAAVPLAVHSIWRIWWRIDNESRTAGLLAAFYLGWLVQAVVLQRGFDYVRVPDTILALAVISARGWSIGCLVLAWFVLVSVALNVEAVAPVLRRIEPGVRCLRFEKHPMFDPEVMQLWPRAWRDGRSSEMRDKLGWYVDVHCGTKWEDLEGAAAYLRTVDPPLQDRELTCWHDSTHPLYLTLGLEPSTRYMHFGTVMRFRNHVVDVRREVASCPQRYVVSDLRRMTYSLEEAYAPGAAGPNSLPAWFPISQRNQFPWDQPIVFRRGRYLVHRIDHPPRAEQIDVPDWYTLDQLGPGMDVQGRWKGSWRDPD